MRRALPLLAFLAVAVALVPSVLSPSELLFQRDLLDFFLPMKAAFARAVQGGDLPWWDPWTYGGQPFFATLQSQVLYPPNWLFAVAPLAWGMSAFVALHLAWAGLGAFLLARELGARPAAAGLAAVAFEAGGYLVSLVDLTNQLCAEAWLPWTCLAACRAVTGDARRATAAWAACCGMAFLGGEPQYAALGGVASVALAWARGRECATRDAGRRAILLGGAAATLALAACAVQLVPFVELLRASERVADPTFAAGGRHALEPARLAALVQAPSGAFGGPAGPYVESLHVGVLVLALALAGLARRSWLALALAAGTLASVAFALGPHLPLLGGWQVEGLSFLRYPIKNFCIAALFIPLAAGLGAERALAWLALRAERGARWAGWGLALASGVAVVAAQARLVVTLPGRALLAPTPVLALLGDEAKPEGPRVHVAPLTAERLRRRAQRMQAGDLAGAMRERVELLEGAVPMIFAIPSTGGASALVPRVAAQRLLATDGPLTREQVATLRAGWLLDSGARHLPLPLVAESPEARLYRLDGWSPSGGPRRWHGPNVVEGPPGQPAPSDWPGWREGPPGTWTFRPTGLRWLAPLSAATWLGLAWAAAGRGRPRHGTSPRRPVANAPDSR